MEEKKKLHLHPIYQLLEEYYAIHRFSYDSMIIFSNQFDFRIQNQGGDWQKIRSEEEKARKLNEYQKEMIRFGAYLKNRFYQGLSKGADT